MKLQGTDCDKEMENWLLIRDSFFKWLGPSDDLEIN